MAEDLFLRFVLLGAVLKTRHQLHFVQINAMQMINASLGGGILAHTGADVAIEHRIGKAELVFVGEAAQPVRGCLVDERGG